MAIGACSSLSPGVRGTKRPRLGSAHEEDRYECPERSAAGMVEDVSSESPSPQASTPTSVVRSQASGESQTHNSQSGLEIAVENPLIQGFPHSLSISG